MKRIFALILTALLLTSGCGQGGGTTRSTDGGETRRIAAVTYPVALFAEAVTAGVDGVTVTAVVNQSLSCLHDYTLTTSDMRVIEGADLLLLSGAGLEDFMAEVPHRGTVVDCSAGIELLHHDGEADPHIWMDPARAAAMTQTIAGALSEFDPGNAETYRANADEAEARLLALADRLREQAAAACPYLITFHDGFSYFADALGLTILRAVEEEAGSEASAREIQEIIGLIQEYDLPALYVEENGSDATARAIARETGVFLSTLSMIMSGEPGAGLEGYLGAMEQNAAALALPKGAEGAGA